MSSLENLTDLGNARRLVRRHGHRIRYVHAWNRWLVFTDGRWAVDVDEMIRRLATETICAMYAEASAGEDATERKQLAAHAGRSEAASRLLAMLLLARSEPGVPIAVSELDAHPLLFNAANGTVDLTTGALRPADSADFLTKQSPIRYDADATCPQWLAFLDRIFAGDTTMIRYLQRVVGYILTGLTTEQCLFILHGAGSNGKTTLLEVLRRLLGRDYALTADFSLLVERNHHGGPRNDVAALCGSRLVTASEVPEGSRLNVSLMKALTGGDTLTARRLYEEAFEFDALFKILIAANDCPVIKDPGPATWRRLRLLPFLVTIPDAEKDKTLKERLPAEEGSGILNWAIEGCLAWRREGLGEPLAVATATAVYREESDTIGQFLKERCTLVAGASARADALYAAYTVWARGRGELTPMSSTMFGKQLSSNGLTKDTVARKVVYFGVLLRSDDDASEDPSGVYRGSQPLSVNLSHEGGLAETYENRLQTTANPCSEAQRERRAIQAEPAA